MFQFLIPLRSRRQRFKSGIQIEAVLGARPDIAPHIEGRVEGEILRKVADDKIATSRDHAAVRILETGEEFQKRGLAAPIAPDQPNALALVNCQRGGIEYRPVVVTNRDF